MVNSECNRYKKPVAKVKAFEETHTAALTSPELDLELAKAARAAIAEAETTRRLLLDAQDKVNTALAGLPQKRGPAREPAEIARNEYRIGNGYKPSPARAQYRNQL